MNSHYRRRRSTIVLREVLRRTQPSVISIYIPNMVMSELRTAATCVELECFTEFDINYRICGQIESAICSYSFKFYGQRVLVKQEPDSNQLLAV